MRVSGGLKNQREYVKKGREHISEHEINKP